jgi:hypothetical protein
MSSNAESPRSAVPERLPVYHRWKDSRSPLVVEINLDLIPRILSDLQAAENLSLEGGGVLIGSFPTSMGAPVLRIEDFETVARRKGDGLAYVLLAEQRSRFTAVKKRVATREVSAVGFFRSHLRSGPFELTLADRDLLSAEFKNSIHVALLVGKDRSNEAASHTKPEEQRHVGAYFVSVNGIIQNRVDPQTMPFEATQLGKQTQGKMPADEASHENQPHSPEFLPVAERLMPTRVRGGAWFGLSAIALLSLLFCGWGWHGQGRRLMHGIMPGLTQPLSLTVSKELLLPSRRQALIVGWDQLNPVALAAGKAHLTITNSSTQHTIDELELKPDDLALGSLRVEMDEQPAVVSLVLSLSNGQETRVGGLPVTDATVN